MDFSHLAAEGGYQSISIETRSTSPTQVIGVVVVVMVLVLVVYLKANR